MALASAVRYTGTALDLTVAVALLGVAVVHAAAGVPTAVLPAAGGLVLVVAAFALAPPTRHRVRRPGNGRGDLVVFVGGMGLAALCLLTFVVLGRAL